MQEVWGSNPRLGGLHVTTFRVSGGRSTLQSRASSLQITSQGNSIRTKTTPPSQEKQQIRSVAYLKQKTAPFPTNKRTENQQVPYNKDARKPIMSEHYNKNTNRRPRPSPPAPLRQFREPPLGQVGFVWEWRPSFTIFRFGAFAG